MKNFNLQIPNFKLQVAVSVAVLSLVQCVTAAEPDERRPRRGPPPPDRRLEPPRAGMPLQRVLTEEQRQDLRELLRENEDDIRDLAERIRKAREELDEATFAEKADEKVLKKKASALAKLEAERHLMHARAITKLRPSLSREQIDRLRNERERFRGEMRSQLESRRERPPGPPPRRREAGRRPPGPEGEQFSEPPRRREFRDERPERPPLPPDRRDTRPPPPPDELPDRPAPKPPEPE